MTARAAIVALAGLCALAAMANAASLSEREKRGRDIYLRGESASGRAITAIVGEGEATELAASALPCGSCHGAEGRGVPEGTIEPANIRWSALSTYLAPPDGRGRRRPRYDDAQLARALRSGRDSADNRLSPVMPRYRLDDRDLADLLSYLHRLGEEPQPGLTDAELTIATIVPLTGPRASAGVLTRAVLEAMFADVNANGGLYGRSLRLHAIDAAANDFAATASATLAGDSVFAVLGASSIDPRVAALIDRERIPLLTPFPFDDTTTAPSSFFLFSDLEAQVLALANHAGRGARNVRIVRDDTASAKAAAEALEERASSLSWNIRGTLAEAKGSNDLVFVIGGDPRDVLERLTAQQSRARVLIAGAPVTGMPAYANSILISTPSLPTDLTEEASRELQSFIARHEIPTTNLPTTIATASAAKLLLEALKRAGRDVTRERVIATLETFYRHPTGLTPPVTFARNRHIGSNGAYILTLDPQRSVVASGWIDAE